jgi:hypothetical protein
MILILTQSAPVDPDWLLSSTAQSAAVLVAIVGGFLVSRLVTLSAERSAIIQRRHQLDRRRQIKQVEYDEVRTDRLAVSSKWFVDHHKDELLAACGDIEVESLLDFVPVGSSYQEMRPVAEKVVNSMRTAFPAIESKFSGSETPPHTSRELQESGVAIPEGSEYIYEIVAEHIADTADSQTTTPTGPWGLSIPTSLVPGFVPTPEIVYQRQDARIDLERQLNSELRALNSELALIDEELSAFKKPEGIKGAIIALTYLALVGIALPTILMALRPVPDGSLSRTAVVTAFISGLGVLLGYLLFRMRSLRPPSS